MTAGHARVSIPTAASVTLKGPWVLSNKTYPSGFRSALVAATVQLNVDLVMSAKWIEREVLDTEL